MAKSIILKPIKECGEKEGKKVLTSIRLYVGQLHVATVNPGGVFKDEYYCHTMTDIINVDRKRQPLEDIKMQIELSLKEFINKVLVNFEK